MSKRLTRVSRICNSVHSDQFLAKSFTFRVGRLCEHLFEAENHAIRAFQAVFPEANDAPSIFFKRNVDTSVARFVSCQLLCPIISVRCGIVPVGWAPVPKTSVHKYRYTL